MHRPLTIQKDHTILLDVDHPLHTEMRDFLAAFADLEQSLQHLYLYRLTRLSLWNAAAAGHTAGEITARLALNARHGLPAEVAQWIAETMARFGRLVLRREGDLILLGSDDPGLIAHLAHSNTLLSFFEEAVDAHTLRVRPGYRGLLKQRLRTLGYPPTDMAGYLPGAPLALALRGDTRSGRPFSPRPYQQAAAQSFCRDGAHGGSGVIVLPCGAGKTVVGLAVMARLRTQTLILCPHTTAVHQWREELLDKTTLEPHQVGEYTGERKEIAPVTLATYQILTYRPYAQEKDGAEAPFPHFRLFGERDWGLIVYDEVHLLPAPVFRLTAEIQARRRLGLTATLVREDGRQGDVFSLIGPKVYEAPWRQLEAEGWLAVVHCWEVRVPLSPGERLAYVGAETGHAQSRLAAENPAKVGVVRRLVAQHPDDRILVIGRYLRQLRTIAEALSAPLITGQTAVAERERLYAAFRRGEQAVLVVSNVANFALDLPEANVAIQVSGMYGSRQEEAQRLGRLLRPKPDGRPAHFYTLVSQGTMDQDHAAKRQRFLVEQGYRYIIVGEEECGEGRRET
jgi:DNA excision repair protein ERCC-3